MSWIDQSAPVLVTGATGYVAGWIVQRLLARGCTVHAAVRGADDKEKLAHLEALKEQPECSEGKLRYFESDLLKPGSYAEAMAGCELVFHTASPFSTKVDDPIGQLVLPAQLGTRNVLEQAKATPSVRRVVLTSSVVAIYGDNADRIDLGVEAFSEAHWNETSSADHQPYPYSKTLAEKEAWRIADGQRRFDLVTINPSLVIGPGLDPHGSSESFDLVRQLGDGTMKSGVPHWGIGAVDVRDLADAHLAAGFRKAASGRYIVSGHDTSFMGLADALRETFGRDYPLPKKVMPKALVWLFAPMVNKLLTRKLVSRNVGYDWRADNGKSVRELGVSYRPLEESMVDFFQQMIDSGQLG